MKNEVINMLDAVVRFKNISETDSLQSAQYFLINNFLINTNLFSLK